MEVTRPRKGCRPPPCRPHEEAFAQDLKGKMPKRAPASIGWSRECLITSHDLATRCGVGLEKLRSLKWCLNHSDYLQFPLCGAVEPFCHVYFEADWSMCSDVTATYSLLAFHCTPLRFNVKHHNMVSLASQGFPMGACIAKIGWDQE